MLGVKNYGQKYIDGCRSRIDADLAAFALVPDSPEKVGFEPRFFNNLLVVLDASFVHRLRTVEGKDGNPLNEVRILCNSILNGGGHVVPDNTIKYVPAKSVLGLEIGDVIALSSDQFSALSTAFFAEIERKFL